MDTAISLVLGILQKVVPALSGSTIVGQVVAGVAELAPIVIKEAPIAWAQLQSIIADLKGNADITDAQLQTLQATEAAGDAAFEAAAQQAEKDDGVTA